MLCSKKVQVCKKLKSGQGKERQVIAVAKKGEGELWPLAGCGKALSVAVWQLLPGSLSSHGPKWQGASLTSCRLHGDLVKHIVCCLPLPAEQGPREGTWSSCHLLQRLKPGYCNWWGMQVGWAFCQWSVPLYNMWNTEVSMNCPWKDSEALAVKLF